MDALKKTIEKYRTLVAVLLLGFPIFINCCGFPAYNFSKGYPPAITATTLLLIIIASGYIGGGLALLFPQQRYPVFLALLLLLTGAGLLCRFLLEFGEVSNVYNFTLPNLLFHLFLVGICCSLSWLYVRQHR